MAYHTAMDLFGMLLSYEYRSCDISLKSVWPGGFEAKNLVESGTISKAGVGIWYSFP